MTFCFCKNFFAYFASLRLSAGCIIAGSMTECINDLRFLFSAITNTLFLAVTYAGCGYNGRPIAEAVGVIGI